MGLNLNSLKNLSATPVNNNATEVQNTLAPIVQAPQAIDTETPKNNMSTLEVSEKIPATGPKISLMKLKKAGKIDTVVPPEKATEEEMTVAQIEQAQTIEAETFVSTSDIIPKEEIINAVSNEGALTQDTVAIEIMPMEEVLQDSKESESIVLNTGTTQTEEREEVVVSGEQKEFFPKFQVMENLGFDDDLLDIKDSSIIDGEQKSIISQGIVNVAPTEEVTTPVETPVDNSSAILSEESPKEEEIPVITIEKPTEEELSAENIQAEDPNIIASVITLVETPAITPEYVAEVKTELSEQRRAGFRFFVQKNTRIVAGIGVVLSISIVALFAGPFLSTDMQESGKSNIQETVVTPKTEDEVPVATVENIPTTEIVTPVATAIVPESSDYELGRDYTVTKNTKKNIRTKTPTDTSSGIETPTP